MGLHRTHRLDDLVVSPNSRQLSKKERENSGLALQVSAARCNAEATAHALQVEQQTRGALQGQLNDANAALHPLLVIEVRGPS